MLDTGVWGLAHQPLCLLGVRSVINNSTHFSDTHTCSTMSCILVDDHTLIYNIQGSWKPVCYWEDYRFFGVAVQCSSVMDGGSCDWWWYYVPATEFGEQMKRGEWSKRWGCMWRLCAHCHWCTRTWVSDGALQDRVVDRHPSRKFFQMAQVSLDSLQRRNFILLATKQLVKYVDLSIPEETEEKGGEEEISTF